MPNYSKQIVRFLHKFFSWLVIVAFWLNTVLPAYAQTADDFSLPVVGEQVSLSQNFTPLLLKAVKVHPDNPFQFDFIVDEGSSKLQDDQLKSKSQKLIRYFLAALTTPENDLWVNLSPYEKNRIIPQSFGTTEMGRDLLGQDYLLKQITATLLYPEGELGKKYWNEVNKIRTLEKTTSVQPPATNLFNKVWIVPQKAVIYENGATAYVDETYLKVMMEEEYMFLQNNVSPPLVGGARGGGGGDVNNSPRPNPPHGGGGNVDGKIFRSIILPELEKEVNEGKNFAPLRQIYNSLILANWYKKRLKDSILSQVYVDKNKVAGIDLDDKEQAQKIYAQYVEAFKKGVYNYIKEDYDPLRQEILPRKYFSGGMGFVGSSAATQYRQGLPKKVGVASSSLRRIIVDIESYSNGDLEDQRVRARFAEIQAQNNDKARAIERKKRAHEIFSFSGLTGIDFASYYETSQSLAHTPAFGGIVPIQPLLIKFIDDVFEKALDLGDPQSTQIVFLQAGAEPIYDVALLMAKVSRSFPVENLKSVWATMGNYRAMKEDNDQKLLFIKYLHDQGVLTPQTKNLLIVDTDAGIVEMGTAAIFAKTLLDNEVIQAANERFGLNIKPFNESGSENTLDFSYLYSAYVYGSMKRTVHIRTEKISGQIDAKLRIEGYNENTLDIDQAIRISNLWYPVDSFIKTTNISDSFSLDDTGRAVVTLKPPNKQPYDNLKILNLVRAVEDIGLLMGILNFMNTKGYDVRQEADQLIANLEKAFKTSGVTQADIDSSKPQPGYRASSSLIPASSAENIGVASSNLFEIDGNLNLAQTGVYSLPNNVIQPEDKRSQINIINAEKRWESVQLLFKQFFSDGFYKLKYKFSRALAYKLKWREGENTAILLPQFIDEVFRRALRLGDVQSTKIVFLKAGAQPLYDAAQLMAKVSGVFPKENLKSVWATMNNYRAMKADPEQAVLFIGYLFEQGVLTSETKHLLIVDTDTGLGTAGTELIFAETLLNNDVINKANLRFGLNIAPFNEEGSQNSLDLFYMTAQYDRTPGLFDYYMNYEKVGSSTRNKLRISGFPAEVSEGYKITQEIAGLWSPVDRFVKTENIQNRFILNSEGRVIVKPFPPVKQFSQDMQDLILARISEDTGLLMGVLDVLEGRGFDVTEEADRLIANLEKALKTSGVTQADIDVSKPQPGYIASSPLKDGRTPSEILLSPQDLARSQVIEVLYTSEDIITKYCRMTLRIRVPDGNIRILKLYSDRNNFNNESLGYAVAQKLGMHVPKHQEFENLSDFEGLVDQVVKIGNVDHKFFRPYSQARLIEPVQEYKSDMPYSGLEELVVFTHLMRFEDYDKLMPQQIFSRNIFFTKDGKYVVYDYETGWDVDFPTNYFSKYKDVADRIDQDRLENAIKNAEKLTADDFSDMLADEKSRQAFQSRVMNFRQDMIRQLGYLRDEPQAVRLLEIITNMQSSSAVGGIDLTAGKTLLDIRGQDQPVEFNFDSKQLQNLQFDGLVPVIINIVPVVNLPLFLTEKPVSKPTPQLSRSN